MENLELKRQVFHGTLGVILVALLHYGILDWFGKIIPLEFLSVSARPLLIMILIGLVLIALSRRHKVPFIYWLLITFERPKEIRVFPGKGAFFAILGMLIVVVLFSPPIAMASILILSLGDSISHLAGEKIGRTRHPLSKDKFLEGHIIGALAGAAGAALFVPPLWALIAALIAMLIEGIDIDSKFATLADDNLVVPITAGLVLFIINSLVG
ncbi:MAG: hypothetical protein KGY45_00520 [Hadesarchaea archaeon]|nr:hypothetical protein [Hadesarchaea archaeon]